MPDRDPNWPRPPVVEPIYPQEDPRFSREPVTRDDWRRQQAQMPVTQGREDWRQEDWNQGQTSEAQPEAPPPPHPLEEIIRLFQQGISIRQWDMLEGALFRLRNYFLTLGQKSHFETADPDALRQAEEDAQPERRAQIEADEAARVAEEHRAMIDRKALDNRDRYGSAQVDNSAREAFVAQENAEQRAFAQMSEAERREWNSLSPDERRDALKNNRFSSLQGRNISEQMIAQPTLPDSTRVPRTSIGGSTVGGTEPARYVPPRPQY